MKLGGWILLTVALVATAGAEDVKSVAKDVYAKIDHGFLKRDIKGIDAGMRTRVTKDFAARSGKQKMTYAQLLKNFQNTFNAVQSITTSASVITKVEMHGNTATIYTTDSMAGSSKGPDGKRHTIKTAGHSRDVWRLVAKKWMYASTTELDQKLTVDGRAIPQGVAS